MIPEKKFIEIAKGFLEKTKRGKVDWKETSENTFRVKLPQSTVQLGYHPSEIEPDRVLLTIFGENGKPVAGWTISEDNENWEVAAALYSEVTRRVIGWDKALADVERFIAKE